MLWVILTNDGQIMFVCQAIIMPNTKYGNKVNVIKIKILGGKKDKEIPSGQESKSPTCSLRYDGPMNG